MMNPEEKRIILMIDDSSASRAQLKEACAAEFQIQFTGGQEQALQVLRRTPDVDVILLNLEMMGADGYSILAALRRDEVGRNIPVVTKVASEDVDAQLKALEAGALDVFVTPVNPKLLLRRIQNIIACRESNRRAAQNTVLREQLRLSEIDEKTGVYSKQTFCRKTSEMLQRNQDTQYVLFRWDTDHFKVFNDIFGVAAGDVFLARVGRRYRKLAAGKMTYGYLEADHFVGCMPLAQFQSIHIEDQIAQLVVGLYEDFEFVTRIGVYQINDAMEDVTLMCDRALLALRSIKNNYTVRMAYYDASMRAVLLKEQRIISEMNTALEQGQFIVYLQPQYNHSTGKLHGAEALVHWLHPERGVVSPGEFIPIFERNGFISNMDEYVWEQVCRFQRMWLDRGLTVVPISVNISRRDIYNPRLCEIFTGLIRTYRLDPSMIRLEITESAYMENPDQLIRTVSQLQEAGFAVEMDDFGSGYSSLNMLKEVPVDMLKLDMRFLGEGTDDVRSGSILTSVIRMAHWINLPVIAEGVETKAQADYLKSVGCVYIQGYYYAKPMPVEAFEVLLRGSKHETAAEKHSVSDVQGSENFLSTSGQASLLFNSFVGGAGIVEFDGTNVEALRLNDQFFQVLGTTREEYSGSQLHMQERFEGASREAYLSAVRQATESGKDVTCTLCSAPLKPGGEHIHTKVRLRLLAKNGGRSILYLDVANISQHVELMARNSELTEQLSAIMDSVPGGILDFEWTDHLRMVYANDVAASMFGYSHREYCRLFAETPLLAVHPDQRSEVQQILSRMWEKSEHRAEVTFRHICADGTWKWVRLTGHVIRRTKNAVYTSGILMDIDAQVKSREITKRQAEKLERQRISLQAIYDTIPCGIMQLTVERDSSGQRRLISFNNTVWQLLGYTSRAQYVEDVRGQSKLKNIHPDDWPAMQALVEQVCAAESGVPMDVDHRIVRQDGVVRWLQVILQKVCCSASEQVLQVVFADITEGRKEHSKRLSDALLSIFDDVVEFDLELNTSILRASALAPEDGRIGRVRVYDESIQKLCTQLVHPQDAQQVAAFFSRETIQSTTRPKSLKYRYRLQDGTYGWVSTTILSVHGTQYLACNRIITAEKSALDLALENERLQTLVDERQKEYERSRLFIESTGMIVFDYDVVTDTNRVQQRVSDGTIQETTEEQYLARILQNDTISVLDRQRMEECIRECIREPQRRVLIYRSRRFGHGFCLCRLHLAAVADKAGQVYRIIGQSAVLHEEQQESELFQKLKEITGVDYHGIPFDQEMISHVLQVLAHTEDIRSNVETVFEQVGRQLDVSRVYIMGEEDSSYGSNTYEWHSEAVGPKIQHLKDPFDSDDLREKYINMFDENGVFACSDVSELPGWIQELMEPYGITAFLQCAILHGGVCFGYMGLDACGGRRDWTDRDLQTLKILAEVVSMYLFRSRGRQSVMLPDEVIRCFEESPAYTYIIDPDTCEVLYCNKSIVDSVGMTVEKMPCYRALMHQDTMCDPCPLQASRKLGVAMPVVIQQRGKRCVMQASPVCWHGRSAVLISGTDATTFAQSPEEARRQIIEQDMVRYTHTLSGLYDEVFEFNYATDGFYVLFSKLEELASADEQSPLSLQAVLARRLQRVRDPQERKAFAAFLDAEHVRAAFQLGRAPEITYTFVRLNGMQQVCSSTLLQIDQGRYLCCNKDVTEQVNAEKLKKEVLRLKAQAEAQERYRIVVERTGIAVTEMNYETGKFSASELYHKYEISRHSQTKMFHNQGDRNLVHPEDQAELEHFFDVTESGAVHAEAILRLKMVDGSFRWTRMTGDYIREETGRLLRSIGTFTDMDEEIRIKRELEVVAERLNRIVANLPVGIVICELRDQSYPLYISDKDCEMFGFTPEEYDIRIVNGRPTNFVLDLSNVAPEVVEDAKRGKATIVDHVRAWKKDGSWFDLQINAHVVSHPGRAPLAYVTLTDVTEQVKNKNQMAKQEQELAAIVRAVPGGIFQYAADGEDRFSFVSENMLMMLGYTRSEFMEKFHGRFSQMVWHEDRAQALGKLNSDSSETGIADSCEYRIEMKNGALKWVHDVGQLVTDERGRRCYVVVVVDIDKRKALEEEVAARQRQMEAMIDAIPGGVTVFSVKEGEIIRNYISAGALRILGYSQDEPSEKNVNIFVGRVYPEDRPILFQTIAAAAAEKAPFRFDMRIVLDDGDVRWINLTANPVVDEEEHTLDYYGVYTDVTERKRIEENAICEAERARMDGVTGLNNRGVTEQAIRAKLDDPENGRCALLLLDLDDMKAINDTYGHIQGDNALRAVAKVLQDCSPRADVVGRIGGDEFMVLLTNVEGEWALHPMLDQLMKELAEKRIGERTLKCSMGCALGMAGIVRFDELYDQSDRALYHVKRGGKGDYAFYSAQIERVGGN